MTRRQKHPLLRKIACRRWRTGRADSQRTWATAPTQQSRDAQHQVRVPGLLSERILTPRETEVLCRVARGETDQQIADKLYLSRRTVSSHVSNILGKLGVANRRDAVVAAVRIGIL
jgi:DNA-binding NarL/FixJ family response regulator